MSRTMRVTLDVVVRPLNEEEIADSGIDQYDDDCQPAGTDEDLDETSPGELAELITGQFYPDALSEMFAGSNIFVTFDSATVVSAEWARAVEA